MHVRVMVHIDIVL